MISGPDGLQSFGSGGELGSLVEQGFEYLRRGEGRQAHAAFTAALSGGKVSAELQLGLAHACISLGDLGGAETAADAALHVDSRLLPALLLKAELLTAKGSNHAVSFFEAALRCAPATGESALAMGAMLARAAEAVAAHAARFESVVRAAVRAVPQPAGAGGQRLADAVDLLCGRKALYLPAPRLLHYPELPAVQFADISAVPWIAALEVAAPSIREEALAALQASRGFRPYVQSDPARPMLTRGGMLDNPDWGAFHLWKDGQVVAENAARCPATMQALAGVPLTRTPGRSPNVLFSLMRPGAHIPPHHGFVNTRLIGHLALVVPDGCEFRVGNDTRRWVEGRAWLFDDTIEHEAWNRSAEPRLILLFEIWRPELDAAERTGINALFDAIDRLRGNEADWGI